MGKDKKKDKQEEEKKDKGSKKDKEGGKKEKEKKVKQPKGTADDPFVLGKGANLWTDIESTAKAAEIGDELFWTTDVGLISCKVIERAGKKQVSWKFNGKQAKSTVIISHLGGLPIEEKAEKGKGKELLVTEEQLDTKYPVEDLINHLEFAQLGKKKQRAKLAEAFEKKKAKGKVIVEKVKEIFELTDADLFHIFEKLDNPA